MYSLQFSKNFPLPNNGGQFEFSNFLPKMAKHEFASVSLTMRDRAISLKFSTHRVSEQCTLGNFQNIFLFPKMAAILIFEFLPKIEKQKFASIFLTVQHRVTSSKFSTQPMQKGMKLK